MIHEIDLNTSKRNEITDITSKINKVIQKSGKIEGICLMHCPHTTAALTLNENSDFAVKQDMLNYLSMLVPDNLKFKHTEGNSDAHIKASLIGNSICAIINDSKLVLGTWQGVMFCEFDGPRKRKVIVKII